MPSFLSGWGKRKAIKYGTTIPGSNLTDFDLLIQILSDSDIGAELSGRKFAVTEADGTTQVPYGHYNDFDLAGGDCTFTLRALFDLDSGASTGDVLGYLYYDDGQTDQTNRSGVANTTYDVLMPMEEDPSGSAPQMVNWAGTGGTSSGSMTSGDVVSGKVANAIDFDGSDDVIRTPASAITRYTLECWFNASNIGGLIGMRETGTDAVHDRELSIIGGGKLELYHYDGANKAAESADVISGATIYHAVGVYDGANLQIYINGSASGSATSAGNPYTGYSSPEWEVGRTALRGFVPAWLDEVSIANVARSADWIAFRYANGNSNSSTVTLGTEETPGGGGYTLTADAGSFTLTGQAAALKATRTLPVAAGSFTLTGQAAALKAGHVVTAATGTFALTGQAAGLSATRTVTAAAGSFTLSGQSATLTATRTMPAAVGTFTLTGQDVGLVVPGKLTADAGAFTISGQAATLRVGRMLASAAGSFTFTGQSAGLACTRWITVSAGTFTLTGQAATLTYSGLVFDPLTFYLTSSRDNSIALTSESETTFNLISRRG